MVVEPGCLLPGRVAGDILAGMTRRSFRLGLSVVALAAVLFLWVSSYYRYRLFSDQGRVLLLVVKADRGTDHWLRVAPPTVGAWEALLPRRNLRFAGLQIAPFRTIERYEYTYYVGPGKSASFVKLRLGLLAVPYWLLALVAAAVPVAGLVGAVRRRARRVWGRCVACGYDLRATSGRCPECGAGEGASQEGT